LKTAKHGEKWSIQHPTISTDEGSRRRIVSFKKSDFGHFISLDEIYSMFSFTKWIVFHFGCCLELLSEKFSDCPKNIALPLSRK